MDWKHLLAYITGTVDQELLRRNAYLVTANRLLRRQITGRVRLTDGKRVTLADLGQKLGKQARQKGNVLLCPTVTQDTVRQGPVQCRERLGGLLKYDEREAPGVF